MVAFTVRINTHNQSLILFIKILALTKQSVTIPDDFFCIIIK